MTTDHVRSSEGVRDVRFALARLFNHTNLSVTLLELIYTV